MQMQIQNHKREGMVFLIPKRCSERLVTEIGKMYPRKLKENMVWTLLLAMSESSPVLLLKLRQMEQASHHLFSLYEIRIQVAAPYPLEKMLSRTVKYALVLMQK